MTKSKENKIKVLIISYFFPPSNFVGGERTFAWAKYLNRFGLYPIIITRQWNEGQKDLTDVVSFKETIHEKYDDYEVYRLPYKNSFRDLIARNNRFKILQKIFTFKELVFANFFIRSLPYSNFYFFAKKLIAENSDIKAVIASGRPFQSFSIGHQLKKDFPHIIWIPDYRDEWSTHQNNSNSGKLAKLISLLESKSELKWTKNANFFLSVSDYWVSSISKYNGKNGFTIKNGFWELKPVVNNNSGNPLTITYAGCIYPSQDLSRFINAVINILKSNKSIYVNFVGIDIIKTEENKIKLMVKGFEKYFSFTERVSKNDLREIYSKTDLLLLTGFSNVKGWYPVKLFDYYSTGIPMLLCPSDNDVMENFIQELNCGFIINDQQQCETKLLELYDKKRNSENFIQFQNNIEGNHYSRLYQSELLANLLNEKNVEFNSHATCLICNSANLSALKNYEESYLMKCNTCNFVFTSLIPTEKELINHYEQYSRDDYLPPLTIKRYNELLDEMEKYRSSNNILDVGCGMGYFLEQALLRGWNVFGTEFTDEAISICENKGITMKQGALDSKWFDDGFFDVITSFEVIEHINNPQIDLMNTNKVLRPGGLFYCTTPNFNSFSRRYLKNKWNNIYYPEHLSYYTTSSLTKMFKNYRLIPEKILTTGISLTRIKSSRDGDEQNEPISSTSIDEILRNQLEKRFYYRALKNVMNLILTFFRLGDTIKVYAIKK
jgi:2-polyprenyl-3-methyl-5-hydroxy-6-metoxy-1,4-benzoquinol methylase